MQVQEALTPPGLVVALRAATRELHDRAERAMNILDPSMDREAFADKLVTIYNFLYELNTQLRCRVAEEKFEDLTNSLARLEEDLEYLQKSPVAARFLDEPSGFFSSLADPYFRIGVFYVLNGSALGGQVVVKHMREKLGLSPNEGLGYFYGEGPKTFELWRVKIAGMREYENTPEVWPQVIRGAEQTFLIFINIFANTRL